MLRANVVPLLLLTFMLLNINFTHGTEEPLDECMVCYDYFPVSFKFPCGHELCVLCAESMLKHSDNNNCPKCRANLPKLFLNWLLMIKIYPIQLIPEISLKKIQRAFALICFVANLTTVMKYVNLGIDVKSKGCFGYFPIQLASSVDVVEYLINQGAGVNQCSNLGVSPISINSQMGNLRLVKYLTEHGADVNQADDEGATPLFNSHLHVVKFLIENGAEVNQISNLGITPLSNVCSQLKEQLSIVKYLVENGANVNQANNNGGTPLLSSSFRGHLFVVQYLVENRANINHANNAGETPLWLSYYHGNLPFI